MPIICKCCKSLTCGIVIGIFSIVGSSVSIGLNSRWLGEKPIVPTVLAIVFGIYALIAACILIYGLIERKHNCLIPYLVAMFIEFVLTVWSIRRAVEVLSVEGTYGGMYLIFVIIANIIIILFSIVIYDHFKRIKDGVNTLNVN